MNAVKLNDFLAVLTPGNSIFKSLNELDFNPFDLPVADVLTAIEKVTNTRQKAELHALLVVQFYELAIGDLELAVEIMREIKDENLMLQAQTAMSLAVLMRGADYRNNINQLNNIKQLTH